MSSHHTAIALTHAALAGTSFFFLYKLKFDHFSWAHGTFGVLCVNSIVGLWKYGNPRYGSDAYSLYELTDLCASLFAVPCAATNMYLNYGIQWELSIIHVIIPVIPFSLYILDNSREQDLVDLIAFGSTVSLCGISIYNSNNWGIAASIMYFFNYFFLRKHSIRDVPRHVMYNLGMCFFCYGAWRTMGESS